MEIKYISTLSTDFSVFEEFCKRARKKKKETETSIFCFLLAHHFSQAVDFFLIRTLDDLQRGNTKVKGNVKSGNLSMNKS